MTKQHYFCNLCDNERDKQDLIAMYAQKTPGGMDEFAFLCWTNARWKETDRHVCSTCIKAIKEMKAWASDSHHLTRKPS